MFPTKEQAEELLKEAEKLNPGPWGNHSRTAAHCAGKIASYCIDMDENKAYVLGLLHDIGRKFGIRHLGHVSDGYSYMMSVGDMDIILNRSGTAIWRCAHTLKRKWEWICIKRWKKIHSTHRITMGKEQGGFR